MQHFLEISQLSAQQIESLLERALHFKKQTKFPTFSQHTVALLFYENSTRTRVSFELAASKLAMKVVQLELQHSSESKGEVIEDTVQTLAAMGIDTFVIRHQKDNMVQHLANQVSDVHFINAGDGTHAHPSQALLDMMTIMEHKTQLDRLKIAIVGDVRHSRVASSFQCLSAKLGIGELVLISPTLWAPKTLHYGRVTHDLKDGLSEADVVICLRVQKERLSDNEHLDLDSYRRDFALTKNSLSLAKPDAIVMHPGPINRGIEIDSLVADGPQSRILQQVKNGVYARMAVFEALVL